MEFTNFPARIRNMGKKGKYVATINIKVAILNTGLRITCVPSSVNAPETAFSDPALPDVQGGLHEFGRSCTPSSGKFGVT